MKKIISLLLAVIMTAGIMPVFTASAAGSLDLPNVQNTYGFGTYKYAANTANASGSDFTEMPEITAIGSGVTTGTKFYGSNAIAENFAEGDSLKEKLADGYYFSNSDIRGAEKKYPSDATTHSSSNWFTVENGTNKMVKFTEAGSGIEFSWTEVQDVARLHLWAYPADSIRNYDIYVEEDGRMKKVLEGSFYGNGESYVNETATFYAINLPAIYNTTKLQFIITELNGEAYITEAVPRSTVEIDLTSFNPRAVTSQSLMENSEKSPSIYINEMILGSFNGTIRSNVDESSGFYTNVFDVSLSSGGFFYQLNTNKRNYATSNYNWDFDSTNHNAFYAVDFGEGKQTITRVTNATSNATGITEVKLYYTDDASAFAALKTSGHTSVDGWTLAGTAARTGINHHTEHVADFDTTAKARYWMAYFEGDSASGSMYQFVGMYNRALPEEYIPPTDSECVELDMARIRESITSVSDGTKFPKKGLNGSTIAVTSDNDAVTVSEEEDNWIINTSEPSEDVTVTITVTVNCGDESAEETYTMELIANIVDVRDDNTKNILDLPYIYSYDYVPATNVKVFGEGVSSGNKAYGEDTEVNNYAEGDVITQLSDGYYFTYTEYSWAAQKGTTEKAVTGYETMKTSANTAKMVKFTEESSGIEFSWREPQEISRLHIWAWPADSINEYEVQIPDGAGWKTVKSGSMNNGVASVPSETNSTFYSILLNEKVSARKIRFVIKSFNENYGYAYLTEALPRKSNEINLISINPLRAANQDTTINATADNSSYSPYIDNSIIAGSNGYWTGGANRLNAWACDNDTLPTLGTYKHSSFNYWSTKYNNSYVNAYYLASFGEGKQKINRIKISTKVASSDKYKVTLYASNDPTEYNKYLYSEDFYNAPDMMAWLKVAETTISGNAVIDIKGVPEARYFKMTIENVDKKNNTQFAPFAFYSLREDELSSNALTASTDPIPEPVEPPAPVIKGELEKAVSIFGDSEGEAKLLTDRMRLTYKEWRVLAQEPGVGYDNARPYKQKDRFVKLYGDKPGLEWSSEVDETISRIDLWAWPAYAINEYEVQNYNDEKGEWETIKVGTLNPHHYALGNGSAENIANNTFWYSIVLDDAVVTNRLRLVIKSFTDENTGVYIAEADLRDTNEINLIATTAGQNDGETFSIYAQNYKVAASTSYTAAPADTSWRGWPVASGVSTVSADSAGNFYYAVSFEESVHRINKATLNIVSGSISEFEVWCADNAAAWEKPEEDDNWTKLTTIRGNFTSSTAFEMSDAPYATYWKIKPVKYSSDAQISVSALYEVSDKEISLFAHSIDSVFRGVTSELAITTGMTLDRIVTTQAGETAVMWECDSPNVNTVTGDVTRMEEDELVILRACVDSPDNSGVTYVLEKTYWILGLHKDARATLTDESFLSSLEDIFAKTEGNVSVDEGKVTLQNNGNALYNISFDDKFVFNGHSRVKINLDRTSNGGEIKLLTNNKEAVILKINGDVTEIIHGGKVSLTDTPEEIVLDFMGDVFNLTADGEMVLYREKMTNSGNVNSIRLSAFAGEKLSLTKIFSDALSSDFIKEAEAQFDFAKISKDGSANLTGDLQLIKKLSDITFVYTSSDEAVNPKTGAVDLSSLKKVNLKVSATSPGGSFGKSFNVMTSGMENVFDNSVLSVSGLTRNGYPAQNAGDNDIDTMFISESVSEWALTVGMPKARYFNKIRLYEADGEGIITSYKISISNDGWNFEDIYRGTTINDGELVTVGTHLASYVKLSVTVSGQGTGLYEVCGYLDQSAEEIVNLDYAEITGKTENLSNGYVFNKNGTFGSVISVTSDNELVSIVEEDGKFKVVENKTDKETHVCVTVTVKYGDFSKTKVYNMILLADSSNIRDNEISGGSGGGGGGGGSLGGGKNTDYKGTHAVVSENAPTELVETILEVYKKELSGHWGEKEIWTLINKEIVVGDGKSLKLSDSVKRAEVLKMIMMAFGYEKTSYEGGFLDVSESDWYCDYAATALKKGLMVGDGINFRGNDSISRQEVAVVLANVLKQKGIAKESITAAEFKDAENIALWAKDSIEIVSGLGLVKGYESGEFLPANSIRRDEAMALIARAMELMKTKETEVAK